MRSGARDLHALSSTAGAVMSSMRHGSAARSGAVTACDADCSDELPKSQ